MQNLLETIDNTPGAVAISESIAIHQTILSSLKATVTGIAVDLGSHAGRSALSAVVALSEFKDIISEFCMVDLLYDPDSPEWANTATGAMPASWSYAKDKLFKGMLLGKMSKFGKLPIRLMGKSSKQFFAQNADSINYAFIDTDAHQTELVMQEVKLLENQLNKGGLIFFHDFGNYAGPVHAHKYLLSTKKYEDVKIDWNAAIATTRHYGYTNDNPKSWHKREMQYPNFVGCARRV